MNVCVCLQQYRFYLSDDLNKPISQWNISEWPSTERLHVIERYLLRPATTYYIRLSAVNENGEGVQSDAIDFTTATGGYRNIDCIILFG